MYMKYKTKLLKSCYENFRNDILERLHLFFVINTNFSVLLATIYIT